MLSPQTIEQIEALATDMAAMFLPPEMIVGCEVLSIADKDQYATNNGWIEARVGRHNAQRCRWRGQFPNVQVGDFVDVLFFASYRLFVVFGQGGAAAIGDIVKIDDPPTAGAIITGDATPAWVVLPPGDVGQYVTKNVAGILEWRDIPTVGITEFLYDTASDIATYFQLKPDVPTGAAQTIVSAAISADDTLIFDFATNAGGPGVDFINDGVWHLHLHAQQSGPGTKDVTLKFRVYYRTDPGGTETQIGTGYSETTGNLTTSATEYDLHLALDELALDLTDRIVLKIYADVSGAGTDPTVTLTVEGTTDSRLEVPALVAASGGGWPFDHVITVSATNANANFSDIQDAIDDAGTGAGDVILLDPEAYSPADTILINKAISVICLDPYGATINFSEDNKPAVKISAAGGKVVNLNVIHSGAGNTAAALELAANGAIAENSIFTANGAATNGFGIFQSAGTQAEIRNCQAYESNGVTLAAGFYNASGATATIYGGLFSGDNADVQNVSGATLELCNLPKLANNLLTNAGTLSGSYQDNAGNIVLVASSVLSGLNKATVSILRESDDGADAWQTDAGGNLLGNGTRDIFPAGAGQGVNARIRNQTGSTITDHFTSGSIPTGFTWAATSGIIYGTPSTLNYSLSNDYLQAKPNGNSNRHFLQKAVANVAGDWQNKLIEARCRGNYNVGVGMRIDNGNSASNQPYTEIYWIGASTGLQTLTIRYQHTVGGGETTTASSIVVPTVNYYTIRLFLLYSGGNYYVQGFMVGEEGQTAKIFETAALSWMPVAGRVGLLFHASTDLGFSGFADHFATTF